MVPDIFVIGDDLPFRVDNVQSGRDHSPLPTAVVTYEFLERASRAVLANGAVPIYDVPSASFAGVVPRQFLQLYDANTNPSGVIPAREYVLRAIIDDNGTQTTKVAVTRAVLDPQSE